MRKPTSFFIYATVAALIGCGSQGDALTPSFLDPGRTMTKDTTKRSWDNPHADMTDQEREDFQLVCTTIQSATGKAGEDQGTYRDMRVRSLWAREMRDQLNRDGRHEFAPKYAKLLVAENLQHSSPECGALVRTWSGK